MKRFTAAAGLLLLHAISAIAQDQPVSLSWSEAIDRARRAPAVVAARMRVAEARAGLSGASLVFPGNPTLDVEAGPRRGGTTSTDYSVALEQPLDAPGRRRIRIDSARAVIAQEEQRALEIERETLRDIATTFVRGIEARERAASAAASQHLAAEALEIAERRYAAGDVARIDVNLARTALALAQAEERSARAAHAGRVSELQALLGLDAPATPEGSLADLPALQTAGLIARSADRPDILLLDTEISEAEAEGRLAGTLRFPDVALRASYAEEEGDRIVLGGIGLTLPAFNRGAAERTAADARIARLRTEREALVRRVEATTRGAIATYESLRGSAADYATKVVPLLQESEALALESYEVGQIGLADLLLLRRESLEARRALIDQHIETRLAEIELRARTGVWK